ncbi:MAG: hypothetical protein HY721_08730, partial [Planctomycetes bacterium]|nr:hypothetical protein [Planctomycetota bacterium]
AQQRDVHALAWHPGGALLAAGGIDSSVVLWDVPARREVRRWTAHPYGVRALAFGPEGEWIASAGWNEPPTVRDMAAGERLLSLKFPFSPDGRWLACGTEGGSVLAFDLETLRQELAKVRLGW